MARNGVLCVRTKIFLEAILQWKSLDTLISKFPYSKKFILCDSLHCNQSPAQSYNQLNGGLNERFLETP